jgi:hypothetical protein
MRPRNSEWQGNFGYWQSDFIHENLLVIGYYAWRGFEEFGRGIVSITVEPNAISSGTMYLDLVQFNTRFIAKPQLVSQIQEYDFDQEAIAQLLFVVDNYHPQEELILLLIANDRPEINLLKNLKISPPECEQQVRRRWAEFQPSL